MQAGVAAGAEFGDMQAGVAAGAEFGDMNTRPLPGLLGPGLSTQPSVNVRGDRWKELAYSRSLMRFLFALLTVLAMPQATRAAENRFAQVHRIAIIAALGDRVEIWAHGWTNKDNHLGYRPIVGWGLDDLAKQTATDLVGNRFRVVPIICDSSSFIVPDMDPPSEDLPRLKTLILALPPFDVDAYLVIRKRTWRPSPLYDLDGLTAMSDVLFRSRNAFVTMQVDFVDARTGETLSARFLPATTGINREDWAVTPEQMTDVQAQNLRRRMADLITRSLTRALNSMGLTGTQAAP